MCCPAAASFDCAQDRLRSGPATLRTAHGGNYMFGRDGVPGNAYFRSNHKTGII
jgi:hypothetical protein